MIKNESPAGAKRRRRLKLVPWPAIVLLIVSAAYVALAKIAAAAGRWLQLDVPVAGACIIAWRFHLQATAQGRH
jgi:hypothetical protein